MDYKIELSILSQAPQLIEKEFKVGRKVLKNPSQLIITKNIRRCVKQIFPVGSFVRIRKVDVSKSHYRQLITVVVSSIREPSQELVIKGMPEDFYTHKVTKLDE